MVNCHKNNFKNTQTHRSLAFKLEKSPIWNKVTEDFKKDEINHCILSWLKKSEEEKIALLHMQVTSHYQLFHNIISKIEANLL